MTITIEGLDGLNLKFSRIQDFNHWARKPMADTMNDIWDNISKYKPKAQGAFSAMATPRQKRAYWARVRSGEISHGSTGYRRSGTLGRSWTMRMQPSATGLRGEVGNVVGYAKYVQSARQQQPFHRATGFQTDEGAIKDTADKRQMIWRNAIRTLLR
jgi:hypothetical protein